MSREKAVKLAKKRGFKIPYKDINKFCKLIGISQKKFFETCEKFRNKKIWYKKKKWLLKFKLV